MLKKKAKSKSVEALTDSLLDIQPGRSIVYHTGHLSIDSKKNSDVRDVHNLVKKMVASGLLIATQRRVTPFNEDGVWAYIATGAYLTRPAFAGFDHKSPRHLKIIKG
ncbi:MAG: hypothetical protein RI996_512 [Candidatus Parcubacteria bacterium]|jgi:hypothetical protein